MDNKELNKYLNKSLENFIKELATNPEKVFDNNELQTKYNNVLKEKIKLQSNWNSLKEWLIQLQKLKGINQQGFSWGVAQEVLDKINELEGNTNETDNM